MIIIQVIQEGIIGTLTMTIFIYLLKYITGKEIKVVRILGTMLTMQTSVHKRVSRSLYVLFTGTVFHYFVGILFTAVYNLLWLYRIGRPDLYWCLLFGAISGLIGVLVWTTFFRWHPNPPLVDKRVFLPAIFAGHLFFGLGVYLALPCVE